MEIINDEYTQYDSEAIDRLLKECEQYSLPVYDMYEDIYKILFLIFCFQIYVNIIDPQLIIFD